MKIHCIYFVLLLNVLSVGIYAQSSFRFDGKELEHSGDFEIDDDYYFKLVNGQYVEVLMAMKKNGELIEINNRNGSFSRYYFEASSVKEVESGNYYVYLRYYSDKSKTNLIFQNFLGDLGNNKYVYFINSVRNSVNIEKISLAEMVYFMGADKLLLYKSEIYHSKDSYSTQVVNLLISGEDFIDDINSRYRFLPNNKFEFIRNEDNQKLEGYFRVDNISLDKDDFKVNGDKEISITRLTLFIGFRKIEYIINTAKCNVSNNVFSLAIVFIGGEEPLEIDYLRRRVSSNYSMSSIFSESSFLGSMDLLYRGWMGFVIEEALREPNKERALEYALDKILTLPDKERSGYSEFIKEIIKEKYRSRN